eukprot:COSAG01_NODE_62993_length_282_cov_0.409836_2_plen_30_part_01
MYSLYVPAATRAKFSSELNLAIDLWKSAGR